MSKLRILKFRLSFDRYQLNGLLASVLIFCVTGFLCATVYADSEAEYLRQLESEALSETVNVNTTPNSTSHKTKPGSQKKSPKKPDEFRHRFERILENERPSTYRFYTKLTSVAKKQVVRSYKKSNKLSTASKKVFDLYFDQQTK